VFAQVLMVGVSNPDRVHKDWKIGTCCFLGKHSPFKG